ncbi:MAG: hydrolase [Myxococcales bacterium]|nr:hydrolase [Myxococcales bacterium]
MSDPKAVVDLLIDSDERTGEGGFLAIRRVRLRNRRADGSASPQYLSDSIARPYGQDAVVVAIYAIEEGPSPSLHPDRMLPPFARRIVRVLVRDCLRPAQVLGRDPDRAPLPEPKPSLFVTELVAGIIEDDDRGESGLRARAAHEVFEEAGFTVDPASVVLLGAGLLPSPGAMIEKFYFVAVEVDPAAQQPLGGDGSPMEEGAVTRWLVLDDAIAACVRGEIFDLKTELGLRRLRDYTQAG